MKICFRCKKEKEINEFYVHKQMGDGHLGKCRECTKKDVKENANQKRDYYIKFDRKRYRNNIKRMLSTKYLSMSRRIHGLNEHSNLIGKDLMPKKDFIEWALGDQSYPKLMKLHRRWKRNGYPRKLAPSIDRINNNLGYIHGNLQWLTQQENVKKFTH